MKSDATATGGFIRRPDRRAATLAAILAGLLATGAALNRGIAPVWAEGRAAEPGLHLEAGVAAAGQGVTLALLGGFRALAADLVWLRMYAAWEQRDLAAVETMVRVVPTMDPRPVYFWLNGARILAYDLPGWRIEAAGGYERVPEAVQERIGREQAELGLKLLAAGMRFHPQAADLWVERASIELNRLRDPLAAAESYRRAWELPDGPYFAARLHAELLRRAGRKEEALAWLRRLHPQLPAGAAEAQAGLVLARIRELERELGVPAAEAYREPGGGRPQAN